MGEFLKKNCKTIISTAVIVVLLAAILIPSLIVLTKKANDAAYQQERLEQQIADLANKLENQEYFTWEDFEAKLAEELAKANQTNASSTKEAIENAIKEYAAKLESQLTGLSEEQVKKIIEKALEGQLTTAQVEAIVKAAIDGLQEDLVTIDQIKNIVNSAVVSLRKEIGETAITPAQMQQAISEAIKEELGNMLTEDQIKNIVNEALAGFTFGGLTKEEIEQIIKDALAQQEILTKEEIDAIIKDALANQELPEGITKEEIEQIVADALAQQENLTKEEIEQIIADAIAKLDVLTKEEIDAIIKEALENQELPEGITKEEIEQIVADALAQQENLTKEEVEEIIKNALAGLEIPEVNKLSEVSTLEELVEALKDETVDYVKVLESIEVTEDVVISYDKVIDLNGKEITIANGHKVEVFSDVTIKNGSMNLYAGEGANGSDLGLIAEENGVLTLSNMEFVKYNNSAMPILCNHEGGKVVVVNSSFEAKGNNGVFISNEADMVITNTTFVNNTGSVLANSYDATILNWAQLTLNDVTMDVNNICVATYGNQYNEVDLVVNGGDYTTRCQKHAAFYASQYDNQKATTITFKGTVYVTSAKGEVVEKASFTNPTIVGLENVVVKTPVVETLEVVDAKDLVEALKDENIKEVKLLNSVELTENVELKSEKVIDLNGNELTIAKGYKMEVYSEVTIKNGSMDLYAGEGANGTDLGLIAEEGAVLTINGVEFSKYTNSAMPIVCNHEGGKIVILNSSFEAKGNNGVFISNEAEMVITNTTFVNNTGSVLANSYDATILNWAQLTLNNVTMDVNNICVATYGNQYNEVDLVVNGGDYTTRCQKHAAFYASQYDSQKATTVTFKGTVYVSTSYGEAVEVAYLTIPTIVGLENVVVRTGYVKPVEVATIEKLEEALNDATVDYVKLTMDLQVNKNLTVTENKVIDLNNKDLTISKGNKIDALGEVTVKNGTVNVTAGEGSNGSDLGLIAEDGGVLTIENAVIEVYGNSRMPVVCNHEGGKVVIVNSSFKAMSTNGVFISNEADMVITNTTFVNNTGSVLGNSYEAAILNWAKLTLNDVTMDVNNICVATYGNQYDEVDLVVNGGNYTSHCEKHATFYASQYDSQKTVTVTFKGTVYVVTSFAEVVEKASFTNPTIVGVENIK